MAKKLSRLVAAIVLGLSITLALTIVLGAKGVSAQGDCNYQVGVLSDNPIAFWRLGETSGPAINLGNLGSTVDGTYQNGVTQGVSGLVPGDPSLAADFDGVDDYVSIPTHSDINGFGPYYAKTIELWFKADALTGKQVLYEQGYALHGLNLFLDGNQLRAGAWINNTGEWVNTTVVSNTAYHVALVFDGNAQTVTGYLNGASFGSLPAGFDLIFTHGQGVAIGAINQGTRYSNSEATSVSNGAHFNGVIDEVALYNSALSPARIRRHAQICTVPGPAVAVVKGGPATGGAGEAAVYTFTVTNYGDTPLQNVQVEDDYAGLSTGNYAGGDGNLDGWLDVTEAWVYTASYTIQPGDPDPLINTVSVTATDALSTQVTNRDTHNLYIIPGQGCDYQGSVLADNPIAYWPLGETSGPATNIGSLGDVVDGAYQNYVDLGVRGLVSGEPDLASQFDNGEDYLSIPDHDQIDTGGPYSAKTVELWFKAYYMTDKHVLFEQGGTLSGLNIFLDAGRLYTGAWADDTGSWVSTPVAPGITYHVALVFDGNTQTVTGYLNGASFGSLPTGFSSIPGHSSVSIAAIKDDTRYSNTLAAIATNGDYFEGVIDEVALYNSALSPTRIKLHARGCTFVGPAVAVVKEGPATGGTGEAVVYTFTVTNYGDRPLQNVQIEDDHAGLSTGNYAGGDGNLDGWLDVTEAWVYTTSYTIQPGDPDPLINTVSVTATDALSSQVTNSDTHNLYIIPSQGCDYQGSVLADNPIAYWPLGETSGPATNIGSLGDVVDGAYENGVTRGASALLSGAPNSAASFDGNDDYISIPNHNQINASGAYGAKTIELWFKANAPLTGKQVLYEQGGDRNGFNIFLDGAQLKVGAWAFASGYWLDTPVMTDTVYHVALVFDGSARTLTGYLNGAIFSSQTTLFNEVPTHPGLVSIGSIDFGTLLSQFDGPSSGAHFNGIIDEVALYDYALSGERIQIHAAGCHVPKPAIAVVKDGPATASVGETAVYTFTVANAGDFRLHNVQVEDDYAGIATGNYVGGDANSDGWLDLTEVWVYTASYTILPTDLSPLTNTVSVTATDDLDVTVTAANTHSTILSGFTPVLTITKEGPSTAGLGDTVVYTFTVNHDPASDCSPVGTLSVTDTIAGLAVPDHSGDANGNGWLDATETWVFTAAHTVLVTDPDPLENTATVAGKDREGDDVFAASNTHSLDIDHIPVLSIVADWPSTANIGDTIAYTFTISHAASSDGSPVSNLDVGDTLVGSIPRASGDDGDDQLEEGESWVYAASYTIQDTDPSPLTNTVTITGLDEDLDTISLSASYNTQTSSYIFLPIILR